MRNKPITPSSPESNEAPKAEFEQEPMGGSSLDVSSFDLLIKMFREQWNELEVSERKKFMDDLAGTVFKQVPLQKFRSRLITPTSLDGSDLKTFFQSLFAHFLSQSFTERPPDNKRHTIEEIAFLHQLLTCDHLRFGEKFDLTNRRDVLDTINGQRNLPTLIRYMRKHWNELLPIERGMLLDQMAKIKTLTRSQDEEREHEDTTYRRIAVLSNPYEDFETHLEAVLSPARKRLTRAQRINDVDELLAFYSFFQTNHLRIAFKVSQ